MCWREIRLVPGIIPKKCCRTRFIGPGRIGITVRSGESVCPGRNWGGHPGITKQPDRNAATTQTELGLGVFSARKNAAAVLG